MIRKTICESESLSNVSENDHEFSCQLNHSPEYLEAITRLSKDQSGKYPNIRINSQSLFSGINFEKLRKDELHQIRNFICFVLSQTDLVPWSNYRDRPTYLQGACSRRGLPKQVLDISKKKKSNKCLCPATFKLLLNTGNLIFIRDHIEQCSNNKLTPESLQSNSTVFHNQISAIKKQLLINNIIKVIQKEPSIEPEKIKKTIENEIETLESTLPPPSNFITKVYTSALKKSLITEKNSIPSDEYINSNENNIIMSDISSQSDKLRNIISNNNPNFSIRQKKRKRTTTTVSMMSEVLEMIQVHPEIGDRFTEFYHRIIREYGSTKDNNHIDSNNSSINDNNDNNDNNEINEQNTSIQDHIKDTVDNNNVRISQESSVYLNENTNEISSDICSQKDPSPPAADLVTTSHRAEEEGEGEGGAPKKRKSWRSHVLESNSNAVVQIQKMSTSLVPVPIPHIVPAPILHSVPVTIPHSVPAPILHSVPVTMPHSVPAPILHSASSPVAISNNMSNRNVGHTVSMGRIIPCSMESIEQD